MSALVLTLGWAADAMNGTLTGDRGRAVGEIVTDSRTAGPGDLFVALQGPRFDAHDFVGDVLGKGAAVVVKRGRLEGLDAAPGVGAIAVDDTLAALQLLARDVRRTAGSKVVAITGSAGKTTTKETIAALLATRFRVVKNKGNLNNHIGLPLSLLQLRTVPDVAVMELGMNHAGEISTLVAIAEPDVRVWTNVGDAHLGFFASPDAIADAKAEILEAARPGSVLVANADDPRVVSRIATFGGRTVTFGLAPDATVRASEVEERGLAGMRARVTTPAGEQVLTTPLLGLGNLSNVLAATAVALEFGIALDAIADAAATLQPADRRGVVRRAGAVTVVDDSYNSSPAALKRALEVIGRESGAGRKQAVLGEMLELGDHAIRLHEECGRAAAAAGLSTLFAVGGPAARALADAAVASGMPARSVHYTATSAEAAEAIAADLRDGDLVLVKGSRGVRTDIVADRIVAERG